MTSPPRPAAPRPRRPEPGPQLVLDAAACAGHGICALCCPDRIALDAWGFPKVDPTPLATPRDLARARRAVTACPEGALALVGPDSAGHHRAAAADPAAGPAADAATRPGRRRRPWTLTGRPVSPDPRREGGWSR